MKNLKYLALAVAGLGLGLFLILVWAGLLANPGVSQKAMGPYNLVYEPFTGDYKKTGKVFEAVNSDLKKIGVETRIGLGIYYDDPHAVPADQLRSEDGAVLEDKDLAKLPEITKIHKYKVLPQKDSIVAELPIKNFLTYMIGPMRAYPALAKYAREHNLKTELAYEVYDMPGKKIYYVMNVVRYTND